MRKDIFDFMTLHKNERINYSAVARQFNCDWRVVKKYHENLPTKFQRKKRIIHSILDEYKDYIREKLDFNCPCTAIYSELRKKGFKGSLRTVQKFAKNYTNTRIVEATVRFETCPGLQAQVDRKEKMSLIDSNGEIKQVSIFLMILGYSRLKYIELTTDQSQKTLFKCMLNAFNYFGGVPKEILFDNMRTVVDRARSEFDKPLYNESFVQFCKDANFKPLSCIRYRPRTKGKVENLAKICNRVKVFNNEFKNLNDLKDKIIILRDELNKEISQATNRIPLELFKEKEREHLNTFNQALLKDYTSFSESNRKVGKDCLVVWNGSKYSLSKKYIGKSVNCKTINDEIVFSFEGIEIGRHKISNKPINYDVNHYVDAMRDFINDEKVINRIAENNLEIFDQMEELK